MDTNAKGSSSPKKGPPSLTTKLPSEDFPHEALKKHWDPGSRTMKAPTRDDKPQYIPTEYSKQAKEYGLTLDELFRKQMAMADTEEPLKLPVNEENEMGLLEKVLIVKTHGFKPPLIKIVDAN